MRASFECLSNGLDVRPLLDALDARPELWNQITARQDTPGSPHLQTETIILRGCRGQTLEDVFNEIPAIEYPAAQLLPQVWPLIQYALARVDSNELGRVLIVKLPAGKSVERHHDDGAYADHYARFHIPLQSRIGNIFTSALRDHAEETVWMQPGSMWWFDHKRDHWLANNSTQDRIHLIIDMVAPKYHPRGMDA